MSNDDVEFNKAISILVRPEAGALRSECWNQLKKDFQLSGIMNFPEKCPEDPNSFIMSLSSFIRIAKNNTTNWDNVNYRIDMPQEIEFRALSDLDYAKLILWRVFQKVWIRRHFKT